MFYLKITFKIYSKNYLYNHILMIIFGEKSIETP
jgi:hypothetical protein